MPHSVIKENITSFIKESMAPGSLHVYMSE